MDTPFRGWEKTVQGPHWAVPRTPTKPVRLVDAGKRGFHFMHKEARFRELKYILQGLTAMKWKSHN